MALAHTVVFLCQKLDVYSQILTVLGRVAVVLGQIVEILDQMEVGLGIIMALIGLTVVVLRNIFTFIHSIQ